MEHLHYQFSAQSGDVVEVILDHAANVQLMDTPNYTNYIAGQPFQYYGGYAKVSPYRIPAPHPGQWNIVVDLGGGPGHVRASVQFVSKTRRNMGEPVAG